MSLMMIIVEMSSSTSGELVATMQRETGGGTPFFKGPCKFTADRNGHIYSLGAFGKYTK